MGTVLRVEGFRFEIRAREANHQLPHVHVWKSGASASIAIGDAQVLADQGMSDADLAAARRIVAESSDLLLAHWRRLHG